MVFCLRRHVPQDGSLKFGTIIIIKSGVVMMLSVGHRIRGCSVRTNGVMIAECLAWLKAVDGMLESGRRKILWWGKQW
ncbi:hypothetical protein C5167_030382 [Papaver somniferum]|nr:hypothetical protein C5167_030382 [Papaver somniferum]